MNTDDFSPRELESPTGAKLACRRLLAKGEAKGVVQILHGMAEHSGRYEQFAHYLSNRGYHVYAHDHRGHGSTTCQDAVQGQFAKENGTEKVIADALVVRNLATSEHEGLPVILFGHSMGAYIGLNVAIASANSFAGFAIWNCDFSTAALTPFAKAILKIEQIFKGSDTPSLTMAKMTFEAWGKGITDRQTDFDWLSNDPAEVQKYIDDPLCGFPVTVSLWRDMMKYISIGAHKDNLRRIPTDKPIHLVGGGHDPASQFGKATTWLEKRLKKLGFTNITKTLYPDARHETLLDIVREDAMTGFADWCDRTIAK